MQGEEEVTLVVSRCGKREDGRSGGQEPGCRVSARAESGLYVRCHRSPCSYKQESDMV